MHQMRNLQSIDRQTDTERIVQIQELKQFKAIN